jgi:diacylglycerol O-acyltransferase/trehalose O-mycolyltransferase
VTCRRVAGRAIRVTMWRRFVGIVALVATLGACSGAPVGSASTGAAVGSVSAPTAAATVTTGSPADDGARVVAVESDGRIRDLTIQSPAVGVVTVRLLVPDRFDAELDTRWPALFLLHGAYGAYTDWTHETDLVALTAASDVVVVMPDAGTAGFYSDWWNYGDGGRPMWETFHLTELPQILERNWRVSDRRVVAGLSMGGYGAMAYAARRPGMFLAAASYSGALDPIGGQLDIGTDKLWGDPVSQASVWQEHDPANLAAALEGTALYVSYGNGQRGPLDSGPVPSDDLESWIADQNVTFVDRLQELAIPVTVDAYGAGSHTWPYWERALHRSFPMLMDALSR